MRKIKKLSLLIVPLALVMIFGTGLAIAATGPEISIPTEIAGTANSTVDVPITLANNGGRI